MLNSTGHEIFVWVETLHPSQQFFSHVGTEPPLPGYYQYFLGGKCILLKDATRKFKLLINIVMVSFMLCVAELENYPANKCWHFNIHEQEKFHPQLS